MAILAAALAMGCGHGGQGPLNHGAVDGWVTARTPHFILHTDAGAGALERTASRFEQTYAALSGSLFGQGLQAPVEALVFADDGQYTELNGNTAGRFIFGIGRTGSVLVARNSDNREQLERVLAHELAHRFVRDSYPRVPNWLSEGIASFVETVEVRPEKVVFGGAPREASHVEWSPGGVSFSELASVNPETLYGGEARYFYAAAWALVHFLVTGEQGRLRSRFPVLLAKINAGQGRARAVREAFADIYPDKTEQDFDEAMKRNIRSLSRTLSDTVVSYQLSVPAEAPLSERPPEGPYLLGLFQDLRERKRVVAEGPPLTARPRFVRAEVGFASLTKDYLGVAGGYVWRPSLAGEVHLGAGPLGLELALLGRYLRALGDGGNFHLGAGIGPIIGVKSLRLGNAPARERNVEISRGDIFYYLGLQPDVAFEIHTPAGIVIRIGAGAYFRLVENQTDLCRPRTSPVVGPPQPCETTQPRSGPQVGQQRLSLHGRFAMGWTW